MPIKLPSSLPAYSVLTNEGVMVMDEELAAHQDIRPLKIGLLNLMPKKIQTENVCQMSNIYFFSGCSKDLRR